MIICPFCKEEIEERSYYCDQCGQALSYCTSCGHVGSGRRCTYCGGIMQSAKEIEAAGQRTTMAESLTSASPVTSISRSSVDISQSLVHIAHFSKRTCMCQVFMPNYSIVRTMVGVLWTNIRPTVHSSIASACRATLACLLRTTISFRLQTSIYK